MNAMYRVCGCQCHANVSARRPCGPFVRGLLFAFAAAAVTAVSVGECDRQAWMFERTQAWAPRRAEKVEHRYEHTDAPLLGDCDEIVHQPPGETICSCTTHDGALETSSGFYFRCGGGR